MSGRRTAAWLVLRLLYPSAAARLPLIASLPRLSGSALPARSWYCVDVPLTTPAGARPGMELSLQQRAGDGDLQGDLQQWLHAALAEGLVEAVGRADESLVVRPGLFPGGEEPSFYREALAAGSARRAALLHALRATGLGTVPEALLRAELGWLHAALVPRQARSATLLWQAAWLVQVAGIEGAPAVPPTTGAGEIPAIELPGRDVLRYRRLRVRLRRHAEGVAARLAARGEEDAWRAESVRAALVARLAHTHTVGLWGPGDPGLLPREAALLRSLADEVSRVRRTGIGS